MTDTHWYDSHLPGEPGLVRCPLNFPSPYPSRLCIFPGQTKSFHILISFHMLISLQGAEWHGTKLYTGLMYAGVNCLYPLCSPLRGSWRPGRPSYQTTSRESSIQRRRSCGMQQFAAGHSYCIKTLCSFKNLLKTH